LPNAGRWINIFRMHTDHEPHSHTHYLPSSRRVVISLGLTLALIAGEAVAGYLSNSLALWTDAAHNATDAIALAFTWYALRLALRPATEKQTYGRHRAGILAALLNSTTLVVISIGIFIEAYHRLQAPPAVDANWMIGGGLLAMAVNAITALLVHHGSEKDLNLRSAYVHLMGDVLSTLGAVAAGVAIAFTGAVWLDALASMLIGLLIIWNAWGILQESLEILLEDAPRDIDLADLVSELVRLPGVRGVHDLHVWSITRDLRMLSAHVVTEDASIRESADVLRRMNALLEERYHIGHATLQLEHQDCEGCPL
jgi:cobalt-zinc-cadmium efflux system protein